MDQKIGKIYMRSAPNGLLISNGQFTFNPKIINTSLQMGLPKSHKRHQLVKKKIARDRRTLYFKKEEL